MKSKKLFYLLSVTWGLPMTLIGYIAAFCVMATNPEIRPLKWGGCQYFVIGKNWGGVSLGTFIFVCRDYDDSLLNHEFGHAIQNCRYGPLFPFIVAIPSATRYWYQEIVIRLGLKKQSELPEYDSIWFEKEATDLGNENIKYWQN